MINSKVVLSQARVSGAKKEAVIVQGLVLLIQRVVSKVNGEVTVDVTAGSAIAGLVTVGVISVTVSVILASMVAAAVSLQPEKPNESVLIT